MESQQDDGNCFWQNACIRYRELFDLTLVIQSSLLENEEGSLQGLGQLLKRQGDLIASIRRARQRTRKNVLPQPFGIKEINAHRQAKEWLTQIVKMNDEISEQIVKKQQKILVKFQEGRSAKKAFKSYAQTKGSHR